MNSLKYVTIAIILMMTLCIAVHAGEPADSVNEDVVLLKNGGTITGRIISNEPGKELQIERGDGQIITVPYDRIASVTDEDKLDSERSILKENTPSYKQPLKWAHIMQIGLLSGESMDMLHISVSNGIMLKPNIYLGLGLGWMNFPGGQGSADIDGDFVPIVGNVRFFTRLGRFQPYVDISPGYSLRCYGIGGMTLGASVGAKMMVDGAAPMLQVGYVRQESGRASYNFFSAMLGLVFSWD